VLPASAGHADVLISGEVTALEREYDSAGTRAIRARLRPSHRLHMGRV